MIMVAAIAICAVAGIVLLMMVGVGFLNLNNDNGPISSDRNSEEPLE